VRKIYYCSQADFIFAPSMVVFAPFVIGWLIHLRHVGVGSSYSIKFRFSLNLYQFMRIQNQSAKNDAAKNGDNSAEDL
jgi:hypothetical protein